jgi:hypothetical protein
VAINGGVNLNHDSAVMKSEILTALRLFFRSSHRNGPDSTQGGACVPCRAGFYCASGSLNSLGFALGPSTFSSGFHVDGSVSVSPIFRVMPKE